MCGSHKYLVITNNGYVSELVLFQIFTFRQKEETAYGYFSLVIIIGPIVGDYITDYLGWRWIFLVSHNFWIINFNFFILYF